MHPELTQRLLEQQATARTTARTAAGTEGTATRPRTPRVRRALARLLPRRPSR